ncbi:hypothetical protein JCM19314_1590 [Nonlabens ulvanivorans]|uniref:Uncharacterized protein n=1 Tax=Nonlabens ulvanivorans TaxID=906888 RepID=A0A090QJT4_NONUL|nr:hypothetical protein JCM19314_1590 [Nonlabens ulvanivorans]
MEFSNWKSELSLVFASEKGVFNVSSKLEKENGEWKVKKLELNNKNTGANTVYN